MPADPGPPAAAATPATPTAPVSWLAAGAVPVAAVAVAWAWLPMAARLALLVCAVACLVVLGLRLRPRRAAPADRLLAASTAVVVVGGLITGLAIAPSPPPSGLPLLADVSIDGQRVPVLVVPQRPGWNLVHIDAIEAAVGTNASHMVTAARRPGATGGWALVKLPAGQPTMLVLDNGVTARLRLHTGQPDGAMPALAGPAGPECASVVLGAIVAGQDAPIRRCPSQALTPADASALRGVISFIAGRGIHHLTLVGDSSPRSVQADRVVLAACARYRITVASPADHPGGPVVITAGWAGANTVLEEIGASRLPAEGAYLAPWLLAAPLLAYSAGDLIPLRFDPALPGALTYVDQLNKRFPGEVATESGYLAWLAARGSAQDSAAYLYAASQVTDPDSLGHVHTPPLTWFPTGTLTQVSETLAPAPRRRR